MIITFHLFLTAFALYILPILVLYPIHWPLIWMYMVTCLEDDMVNPFEGDAEAIAALVTSALTVGAHTVTV